MRDLLLEHIRSTPPPPPPKHYSNQLLGRGIGVAPELVHLHPKQCRTPGVCIPYTWETTGYALPAGKNLYNLSENDRVSLLEALDSGKLKAVFDPDATTRNYKTQSRSRDLTKEWDWSVEDKKSEDEEEWKEEWENEKWVDWESLDEEDEVELQAKGAMISEKFVEHLQTGEQFGTKIGKEVGKEDLQYLRKNYGIGKKKSSKRKRVRKAY